MHFGAETVRTQIEKRVILVKYNFFFLGGTPCRFQATVAIAACLPFYFRLLHCALCRAADQPIRALTPLRAAPPRPLMRGWVGGLPLPSIHKSPREREGDRGGPARDGLNLPTSNLLNEIMASVGTRSRGHFKCILWRGDECVLPNLPFDFRKRRDQSFLFCA